MPTNVPQAEFFCRATKTRSLFVFSSDTQVQIIQLSLKSLSLTLAAWKKGFLGRKLAANCCGMWPDTAAAKAKKPRECNTAHTQN